MKSMRFALRQAVYVNCLTGRIALNREPATSQRALSSTADDVDWKEHNIKTRVDLATAYRGFHSYDHHESIYNHLTAKTKSVFAGGKNGRDIMLVIPFGTYWSEVTARCLIGVDIETGEVIETSKAGGVVETTANCIHRGIYISSQELGHDGVKSIMHFHPKYATALACLKDPTIRPVHQTNPRFCENIAYYREFGGIVDDLTEGKQIGKVLDDRLAMMMCNHGILTVGPTVAQAFDRAYFMERACMFQMIAMSTGQPMQEIPPDVAAKTAQQDEDAAELSADAHINGLIQVFRRKDPRFDVVDEEDF